MYTQVVKLVLITYRFNPNFECDNKHPYQHPTAVGSPFLISLLSLYAVKHNSSCQLPQSTCLFSLIICETVILKNILLSLFNITQNKLRYYPPDLSLLLRPISCWFLLQCYLPEQLLQLLLLLNTLQKGAQMGSGQTYSTVKLVEAFFAFGRKKCRKTHLPHILVISLSYIMHFVFITKVLFKFCF